MSGARLSKAPSRCRPPARPCIFMHRNPALRMSASAYHTSAPRDVPVPTLDAASTRTSTRDPWPPADQPSRASERTRVVPPNWTLRGFSGRPFGERRWSRSMRRPYLICLFIGQRAGTRAVTWAAWRAAMTRWACGGAGHDHLRVVWRCGRPAYQIRTRVAGSSHNSSAAPTSNAP